MWYNDMKSLIVPEELKSADEDPIYDSDGPRSMQTSSLLPSQRKGKFPKAQSPIALRHAEL